VSWVVVDASVLAAVVFGEPEGERFAARLESHTVCAPPLLKLELANVAVNKAARAPQHAPEIFGRLMEALDKGIVWHDVDAADVAILAHVTGLTVYDAAYLWLAGWLEADLITLDRELASAE
jgi:predicted nucleic acid-binding protein